MLFRAGRYEEAREVYEQALGEFRAMTEPRGEALAALGLVKARARLGRDRADTAADLDELRGRLSRIGLLNAREMVERAYAELGVERTGDDGDGGPAPAASDAPGTSGLPAPAPAAAAHEEVPVR